MSYVEFSRFEFTEWSRSVCTIDAYPYIISSSYRLSTLTYLTASYWKPVIYA